MATGKIKATIRHHCILVESRGEGSWFIIPAAFCVLYTQEDTIHYAQDINLYNGGRLDHIHPNACFDTLAEVATYIKGQTRPFKLDTINAQFIARDITSDNVDRMLEIVATELGKLKEAS